MVLKQRLEQIMGVEGLNRDTKDGWSKGKVWDNLTEVKTSPAGSFLRDLGALFCRTLRLTWTYKVVVVYPCMRLGANKADMCGRAVGRGTPFYIKTLACTRNQFDMYSFVSQS